MMTGRKNLVALELGADAEIRDGEEEAGNETPAAETHIEEEPVFEEAWDEETPLPRFRWVVPALALAAIAGWTAFFGWVHGRAMLSGAAPEQWIGWIGQWSLPVLLVVGLWLLAMRNSVREAHRFGETARLLSAESAALEQRLSVVNRELSLARDFIASQSRDLDSLGRMASERLTSHADRLQDLIRDNGEQVNAIGSVSDTALANMDRLRDQLPVISNAARDVTSQIGNAGNTAQEQLNELVSGFERLNQFGEASTRQVEGLRSKVADALESLEQRTNAIDRQAQDRFAALRDQNEEFRLELETRETDSLAAIRRRAQELGEELAKVAEENREREEASVTEMRGKIDELQSEGMRLMTKLRDGQEETAAAWAASITALQERMEKAITEISRIDEAAITNARARMDALSEAGQRLDQRVIESANAFEAEFARRREAAATAEEEALASLEERFANFDGKIAERQQEHVAHMIGLSERGEALAARLGEFDREMARLAEQGRDEGARLGEITDKLAERLSQSRAILEESGTFVNRLTDDSVRLLEIIRSSADHSQGALSDSIGQAERRLQEFENKATALRATIAEAETKGTALADHVDKSREGALTSLETVEELETRLSALAKQSAEIADSARSELRSAIAELEGASGEALEELRTGQLESIREIAERIGAESSETISGSLRTSALAAIAELEQATEAANASGRATARQMRDQLARVNELARNLEMRVAQAEERAQEKVDNDFSRRMALITESLNSSSIDIAKAIDAEVSDTAWASYLRGDRGIFTRRAVRLLDNHEARGITDLYEDDSELREAVNRYIHDFEAMLRSVLSTRDGNAIAVTLLSSDIGKLYVALAQAIERLRD